MYQEILGELNKLSETKFAEWLRPFLSIKDDSEEILLGVRVPKLRKLAKLYEDIDLITLKELLNSNIHEARLLAVFIMLLKSKKEPQLICGLYLQSLDRINNWDLIDYSCPHIVAPYVDKKILISLAETNYLWANRVAIVSTIYYIKKGYFDLTLELAEKFLSHPHHLIHKATGWMLREIGKKDITILEEFLEKHSQNMPAVMKSYAKEIFKKAN